MAAFTGGKYLGPNPKCEQGFAYQINSSPNGAKIIYGSNNNVVVRDYENPNFATVYSGMKATVRVARFAPDGNQIAAGDDHGAMHILKYQGAGGFEVVKDTMKPLAGSIFDLAWDHASKRIAVVGNAKGKRGNVFMLSGTAQGEISQSTKTLTTVDIRPNCEKSSDTMLVTGSEDMRVRTFKYKGGYKYEPIENVHTNTVNCVRYSPDGNRLISVGAKMAKLYDVESMKVVKEFDGEHKGTIYAASFSPDGSKFITSSADKTVKLWDVETGKVLNTFNLKGVSSYSKAPMDMQVGCTFAGQKIVSLSLCGDINYLDEKLGTPSGVGKIVKAPTNYVSSLAVKGDDITCVTQEGELFSYLGDGTASRFTGNDSSASGIDLVRFDDTVYSCTKDDKIMESSVKSATYSGSYFNLEHAPKAMSKSENDHFITVTVGEVYLFAKGNINPIASKSFGNLEATCGAISPDGGEITIGFKDKMIRTYAVNGTSIADSDKKMDKFLEVPTYIEYSAEHCAVGTNARAIKFIDRASWQILADERWTYHKASINCLAFSPSGKYLVSGGLDGDLIVWDCKPEKKNRYKFKSKPSKHVNGVQSVAWADNDTFYSTGKDSTLRQWSIASM